MRDMVAIAQNQLERVLSGGQLNFGLGLTGAEMHMVVISRDRLGIIGQFRVDQ